MVKTTIKFCKSFFFYEINKNMQEKRTKCFYICGMTSLTLDSKHCNFITSEELIKTPQNFVQDSFSKKSLRSCHKHRGGFWPKDPFEIQVTAKFSYIDSLENSVEVLLDRQYNQKLK